MLRDAHRSASLAACSALLLAQMAGWVHVQHRWPHGYKSCLASPETCADTELILSLFDVLSIDGPHRFTVAKGSRTVPVVGPTEGLEVGASWTFGGVFRADDQVVVQRWREAHPDRFSKKALGLAALGFLALACPMWFTVSGGRVRERDWPLWDDTPDPDLHRG